MALSGDSIGGQIFIWFFGIFLLMFSFLFLPFVLYHHQRKREARCESMESQSMKLGLEFNAEEDAGLVRRLQFLTHVEEGDDRYALHNIWGEYGGYAVEVFDFHWKEPGVWWWSPSWHKHRYYSFVTIQLEKHFPEILIKAESKGPFKRVAKLFSKGDINFESREFSERFDVRSTDKKFAYDFCNARMIEFLMSKPVIPIELENDVLTIGFSTFVPPSKIAEHLEHLLDIRRLMPAYLFESEGTLA